MASYILGRLLLALPTLLGAFVLIFLMTRLVPGDPVLHIMDEHFTHADAYEQIERQLGLDKPAWQQFSQSFTNSIRGDFGMSFQNRRPVTANISGHIGPTVYLAIAALIVSVVIGVPAGIVAAKYRNRWPDGASMVAALLALCAPNFWLGILLLLLFSLKLGWFPTFGSGEPGNPVSIIKHLVLPALTLGSAGAGLVARITRSAMIEVLSLDYVQTARAKGLSDRVVTYRHALRNAMIPIITVSGLEAITLLSGTAIVETVFARRGVGKLLVDSVIARDYPQIQALLLIFVVMAILVNIAVDLLYGVADPRIRTS